ncbi:MAG TPA: hypothetical protein VG847_16585 [Chitinophagaceae bacterium]|nr:hypothetical protein [Chitinophagaceae bacterium]
MKPAFIPFIFLSFLLVAFLNFHCNNATSADTSKQDSTEKKKEDLKALQASALDTAEYNKKLLELANGDTTGKWPAKFPYPLPGAILPFNRIVAFYGNLYSKKMGILGELPKSEMIEKLHSEVDKWQKADSSLKVIPALHYIAISAQGSPGKGGKYRARMPFSQMDTIISWAREINGLIFLDIQVGLSTVKNEVPYLENYLKMPDVNLGIDPEFSMKTGSVPGKKIGTFSYEDINNAIDYLANLVKTYHLPPKILIVHRFTQGMVTGYEKIKKVPEVQIVMDMDGWGDKILKRSTYLRYIYKEPVEFTGFKLFYKNDTKSGHTMYTPEELLKFIPKPVYIQYQ